MSGWISGMLGNLVANILTIPIVFYFGIKFLDRRTVALIYVRLNTGEFGLPPGHAMVKIVNNSTEVIHQVQVERDTLVRLRDEEYPYGVVPFKDQPLFGFSLHPSEAAETGRFYFQRDKVHHISVVFRTSRGKLYRKTLMRPSMSRRIQEVLRGRYFDRREIMSLPSNRNFIQNPS